MNKMLHRSHCVFGAKSTLKRAQQERRALVNRALSDMTRMIMKYVGPLRFSIIARSRPPHSATLLAASLDQWGFPNG
ncbi:hypothetical protein BC938DRAFT_474635 [Jimgerdemannia flammicorona]|uniref:Uncharacterized protein n=1 Tax=Jimgerdemannia flammicorona TaxID=994334 RepID=A0A433Q1W7_9FUNG|nr:hypothetical protein BC938DRAFT_474635 [Jimgerdemannia flammicorona]